MPGMSAKVTGKMKSHRPEREKELLGKLTIGLQKAIMTVEGDAKKGCPVDTGRLRSSITSRIEESTGVIGTTVEYASYVEFGTDRMPARPFLFPAAERVRARIKEFFT